MLIIVIWLRVLGFDLMIEVIEHKQTHVEADNHGDQPEQILPVTVFIRIHLRIFKISKLVVKYLWRAAN